MVKNREMVLKVIVAGLFVTLPWNVELLFPYLNLKIALLMGVRGQDIFHGNPNMMIIGLFEVAGVLLLWLNVIREKVWALAVAVGNLSLNMILPAHFWYIVLIERFEPNIHRYFRSLCGIRLSLFEAYFLQCIAIFSFSIFAIVALISILRAHARTKVTA
jgi:hypothetical protein